MQKTYSAEGEGAWYARWMESGCFEGKVDGTKEAYSIVIPPPNVTGILHMGHVLNNTLQDVLIRRARQMGKSALWVPGTDHAGIATQTRVERKLRAEGTSRVALGREKFLEKACEWRDKHGGIILDQLKKLGVSCDWARNVHTLDPDYSESVLQAFVTLYERGYIYRGKRMVNWCPVSLTALSDEEVVMKPQQSTLYKMRYEVVEKPGVFLEIATTRPETLMGDTAVAVHPDDDRYKTYVGLHCWRPFPRAAIPIIADPAVQKDFGTGVLKITPAHDPADFAIGQRHGLPVIDVFNPDATLNALAGKEFDGIDRFEARTRAVQKLKELSLLVAAEAYDNSVGYSERADVPIEPRLSEQWFLRYPKVEEAKRAVEAGMIHFWPDRWTKTYLHWMNNIRDWCISRQLWWGHRIPVWYKKGADRNDPRNVHVSVKGPADPENWEQEADVLDTWASSWLWPIATMGWPNKTKTFNFFYPTDTLVTGPDILFFWAARMIMASLEFLGDEKNLTDAEIAKRIPFKNVYLTGIIRDGIGRKMSKSLGNSPDPLDLIQKYGADGLRFGILSIAPKGQDIFFDEDRVALGRNFCNKLWNACRYRHMQGELDNNASLESIVGRIGKDITVTDQHILLKLLDSIDAYSRALDAYEFNTAVQTIYGFFWSDFCDWYLEASKLKSSPSTHAIQDLCIRQVLQMLHPITPFIVEELWNVLQYGDNFVQDVPFTTHRELSQKLQLPNSFCESLQSIEAIRELISKGRALKADYNLANKKVAFFFDAKQPLPHDLIELLSASLGASSLSMEPAPEGSPSSVTTMGTLSFVLEINTAAERERLLKEAAVLEKHILSGQSKLASPSFLQKAPPHVVDGAQAQLTDARNKYNEIQKLLSHL
ncbi:MAG: valine--tRNA ligase [Verrucomicrobia bacterium GWF2_51_19]|nr:MAG: valine--tRNA ligase [Verrucomicrobia bacterium GWF2_51_19]HCJ11823.1 valine--tRNA ligase [Opitutae bacterium]